MRTTAAEVLGRWRAKAVEMRHLRASVDGATLIEAMAAEIESALDEDGTRLLTLRQAAAVSGYSTDHLGRLIRDRKLPNLGQKGSPRVRPADLPRKPLVESPAAKAYDPAADARSLRGPVVGSL